MVHNRWPLELEGSELALYIVRKNELSIKNGCVLWWARVVLQKSGRDRVLGQLHQCHLGVSRMKALARSNVWRPKLDKKVVNTVKACEICQ